MSFEEWERMPLHERRHRTLLYLADIEIADEQAEQRDRERWWNE